MRSAGGHGQISLPAGHHYSSHYTALPPRAVPGPTASPKSGQAFPTRRFYHSEGSPGTEKSETSKWKGAGISDMADGARSSVRDSLEMSSSRKPPASGGCRDRGPRGVTAHRGHRPGQELRPLGPSGRSAAQDAAAGSTPGRSLLPPTPDAFWGLAWGPSTARRQTEKKPPGGSASCEPAQAGDG